MIATLPSLYDFAGHWLVALGRASLYGGVVLALVWAACRCFPRLPARWRCWLWRLAFVKLLLCMCFAGSLDVAVLPSFLGSSPARVAAGPARIHTPHAGLSGSLVADSPATPDGAAAEILAPPAASGLDESAASAGDVAALILLGIWTAAVAGLFGLVVARIVAARRWRGRCVLIKNPDILALGERLARQFRLVQPPLLLAADFCQTPMVFGAVRTSIVLPESLVEKMTLGEMRLILAHEMAHIRRGDLVGNWFVSIISGLFFFHPLVWLAFRETRLAQETACDELALGLSGGSIVDYGNLIVDLATHRCRPTSAIVAVGIVESFQHMLKRRLCAMKDFGTQSLPMAALSWLFVAVALLGLLPWRAVAQSTPEKDLKAAEAAEEAEEAEGAAGKNPFAPVRAASGQYTVIVEGARPAFGQMGMQPSGFPMIPDRASQDARQVTRSGGSGGARWSVSAGGMGGGMGGGFAGAYTKPNMILDVRVEPSTPHRGKGVCLLCEINGKVKAVDENGNEFDSPGTPAMWRHRFVDMEYPAGSGCTAIHLYRPPNSGQYLRSLDGELYVIEAKQTSLTFTGRELSRKTSKRRGNVTVQLGKVKKTAEGIDVTADVSPPPVTNRRNMFELMQRAFTSRNRLGVTIEDTEGRVYQPTQTSSNSGGSTSWKNGGSSGGSSGGASWGSSSGSGGGSFGPGGSGGTTWSSGGGGSSGGEGSQFHFDPLPDGVGLKAVHCTVTDHQGKPKAVTFHLENIPLPAAMGE